ncbi:hypothetical protein PLEOSDRAFT_153871 [Pleurotus ostreatus PC15]|uniref:Uncharacterized protein n=1 Tax=Pleurotus ostreatus (strain PC15) TaxID=1137138 RepID=A0A067NU96_PLEO1|nr:hypothetical protein PLEOSDRAFT_153871 [Pleurotus ostreatus PC15]
MPADRSLKNRRSQRRFHPYRPCPGRAHRQLSRTASIAALHSLAVPVGVGAGSGCAQHQQLQHLQQQQPQVQGPVHVAMDQGLQPQDAGVGVQFVVELGQTEIQGTITLRFSVINQAETGLSTSPQRP